MGHWLGKVKAEFLSLGTCGWVVGMKAKYWRAVPLFPPIFSFKSQHAVQESFRQRRALMYWKPGGSEDTSDPPALVLILSALSWDALGTLQMALRRSKQGQRGP